MANARFKLGDYLVFPVSCLASLPVIAHGVAHGKGLPCPQRTEAMLRTVQTANMLQCPPAFVPFPKGLYFQNTGSCDPGSFLEPFMYGTILINQWLSYKLSPNQVSYIGNLSLLILYSSAIPSNSSFQYLSTPIIHWPICISNF